MALPQDYTSMPWAPRSTPNAVPTTYDGESNLLNILKDTDPQIPQLSSSLPATKS